LNSGHSSVSQLTVEISAVDFPRNDWCRIPVGYTLQHNASIGCHLQVTWQLAEARRHCTNTHGTVQYSTPVNVVTITIIFIIIIESSVQGDP